MLQDDGNGGKNGNGGTREASGKSRKPSKSRKPTAAQSFSAMLSQMKMQYLDEQGRVGGNRPGFRQYGRKKYESDPEFFVAHLLDVLDEALDKKWEAAPREEGPNLFTIAGVPMAEHVTRPVGRHIDGSDIETDRETAFEKVSISYATVADGIADMMIKMRKAAQSSAAADRKARAMDEARKRAKGDVSVLLKDVAD